MITKREFFEFSPNATEADWKAFHRTLAEIIVKIKQERMREEDHPLDDQIKQTKGRS